MTYRALTVLGLAAAALACRRTPPSAQEDSLASETSAARAASPPTIGAPPHSGVSHAGGAAGATAVPPAPSTGRLGVAWERTVELGSLDDVASRLEAKDQEQFAELEHEGATAHPANCREWSKLHARGFEPVSQRQAQTDRGALLRCGTLTLLQKAQPAQVSFVRDLRWDQSLLAQLPSGLATALNSEAQQRRQAAMSAGQTLAQYDPKASAKPGGDAHALEIREGGGLTMILLHAEAWGDFNADGQDDVVVSVINGATQGSYSAARLLTLTRASTSEPLKIIGSLE